MDKINRHFYMYKGRSEQPSPFISIIVKGRTCFDFSTSSCDNELVKGGTG